MNKLPVIALFLTGLMGCSTFAVAADTIEPPAPDSTGPNNPTPPTLPTPESGVENGTGTGIDGPDNAPSPGTDGSGRDGKPRPSTVPDHPTIEKDQSKHPSIPGG